MYNKLIIYIFHLVVVFPYLGWLGYRLSNLDEELNFTIDSKLILSIISIGFIYQLLLLVDYLKIIYT